MRKAKEIIKKIGLVAERLRVQRIFAPDFDNLSVEEHLYEAISWLKRAQDYGEDDGVSYGAKMGESFLPSYPETTGYIIPTFLTLAEITKEPEYARRAVAMGEWELSIQMECGAVMGGRVDSEPKTPAVFNTGMVMLGWLALYETTGESRFIDASERAAEWLTKIQESNGRWMKGNSQFANAHATTYNTRVAWALARHGLITGKNCYVEAAVRNAECALRRQVANGWFAECCLSNPNAPLVHTLAYATRGLLELGMILDRNDFLKAAKRTADGLLNELEEDGHLAGRFDKILKATVPWSCLTGSAQMSIIWSKLYVLTKDKKYFEGVKRINRYLMQRHDIKTRAPAVRGGVPGSWPIWGDYGRFMVLNWATKFFVDALLASGDLFGRHIFVSG